MHAVLRIGDAVVELGEPEDRAGIPTNGMFLFVEDVDAVYARALEAGCNVVSPAGGPPLWDEVCHRKGPGWISVVAGTVEQVRSRS